MRVIGVSGLSGSGKDTVADMLVRDHKFVKVAFADVIKRICMEVFLWDAERLWGPSEHRNAPDPHWDGLSARRALQALGTEWGRAMHPDVWVRHALRTAHAILVDGKGYRADRGINRFGWVEGHEPTGVVIPDVRFENEMAAIRDDGGWVVRVQRPGAGLQGVLAAHVSETELTDEHGFDHRIHNAGTLDELAYQVSQLLLSFDACTGASSPQSQEA